MPKKNDDYGHAGRAGMPHPRDDFADVDDVWGIEPPAIVKLGEHRLLVGDCADIELLYVLFDGELAQTIVTSPPYADLRTYDDDSGYTPLKPEKWLEWWPTVSYAMLQFLDDAGSFFLNIRASVHKGQRSLYVYKAVIDMVEEGSWKFLDDWMWVKKIALPGKHNRRFKNAWESIYHFAKTFDIRWFSKRVSRRGTVFDPMKGLGSGHRKPKEKPLPSRKKNEREGWVERSNVLPFNAGESRYIRGHPATFPIALPLFCALLSAEKGGIIFDPFVGSGTTMLAAIKNRYRGYGAEISKKYALGVIRYLVDEFGFEPEVTNL